VLGRSAGSGSSPRPAGEISDRPAVAFLSGVRSATAQVATWMDEGRPRTRQGRGRQPDRRLAAAIAPHLGRRLASRHGPPAASTATRRALGIAAVEMLRTAVELPYSLEVVGSRRRRGSIRLGPLGSKGYCGAAGRDWGCATAGVHRQALEQFGGGIRCQGGASPPPPRLPRSTS
jgi:hypothetical protein